MSAPRDPVRPGEIIAGRYRIERVIGRGAMGLVALATDVSTGEYRAVKLLPIGAHVTETTVERFFREARATSKLASPHAVKVYAADVLPSGAPYMVMEYLEGSDLGEALTRRGAFPAHEAVDVALQACRVLADAHAAGIVHRDLKPTNLFATTLPDGSTCIKVLDFGLAKALFPEEDSIDLTLTNTVIGSHSYMSPEQLRSAKEADPRSDVYSLGVVLYQLVTGRLPLTGRSPTDLITQILVGIPAAPSTLRPGLPLALDGVILRCLEKSPGARFQSMNELAAALVPFVPVRAPVSLPPAPIAAPGLAPGRERAVLLATLIALIVVALALIVAVGIALGR